MPWLKTSVKMIMWLRMSNFSSWWSYICAEKIRRPQQWKQIEEKPHKKIRNLTTKNIDCDEKQKLWNCSYWCRSTCALVKKNRVPSFVEEFMVDVRLIIEQFVLNQFFFWVRGSLQKRMHFAVCSWEKSFESESESWSRFSREDLYYL